MGKDKDKQKEKPTIGGVIWRLTKLTMVLGVIVFILLTVLANLGGNGPVLRDALEDVFSEQTGYDVKIHNLNHMGFFPSTGIDIENVEFSRVVEEGTPRGDPMITVGRVVVAFDFWDLFFGNDKIMHFSLERMRARPGQIIEAGMEVDSAALGKDEAGKAAFRGTGKVGGKPAYIEMEFKDHSRPGRPRYSVGSRRNIILKLDDIEASGVIESRSGGGVKITNTVLKKGTQEVLHGTLEAYEDQGVWIISGETESLPSHRMITPHITLNIDEEGHLNVEDFKKLKSEADPMVFKTVQQILEIMMPLSSEKYLSLEGAKE